MRFALAALLLLSAPASAAAIIFAGGHWAAIDRGAQCDASTLSLRTAAKGKVQARAGFAFSPGLGHASQFYTQLRRPVRPGSTVMLKVGVQPFLLVSRGGWAWSRDPAQGLAIVDSVRANGSMRIEGRDSSGRRFVDHYLLDGAPTAIDAAAAHCVRKAGKKRPD